MDMLDSKGYTDKYKCSMFSADSSLQKISAEEALSKLTLGRGGPAAPASPIKSRGKKEDYRKMAVFTADHTRVANYLHVTEGARLLKEECLWQKQLLFLKATGTDRNQITRQRHDDLLRRAKETGFFLWTRRGRDFTEQTWDRLACSYGILAQAGEVMVQVLTGKKDQSAQQRAAQLMADAVCLVKTLLRDQNVEIGEAQVQLTAYNELIEFAKQGCYLDHLRFDDRVEWTQAPALRDEIERLRQGLSADSRIQKNRERLLNAAQSQADRIALSESPEISAWNKLIGIVTELCENFQEPVSSTCLREILSPIRWKLPEEADTTDLFGRVIQSVDLWVEQARQSRAGTVKKTRLPSPEVEQVRERFAGSKMVFVGGTPQGHIQRRIEESFGIELLWECHSHGDSLDRFTSVLNDPQVKLFLVYIPWCSHKHSEELTGFVEKQGKRLIRVRKGTSPNSMAAAILAQTGGRLAAGV